MLVTITRYTSLFPLTVLRMDGMGSDVISKWRPGSLWPEAACGVHDVLELTKQPVVHPRVSMSLARRGSDCP